MPLPLNVVDMSNSDRLSVTRHYLTAREWTHEGTYAQIDAAAFAWERDPHRLAKERGERSKAFLIQLGLAPDDIHVHERVIELKDGKADPDDRSQLGVEFYPKCPPSGCMNLCSTGG
jgi:hypothetical protein